MLRWRLIMVHHWGRSRALAPSDAEAPLACPLAGIVVTEPAHLITIPFLENHVAVRAELFVGRDARSADVEKAHHVLL
jgi:hypothetical protein